MSPALMVISHRFFLDRLNIFRNILQAKLYFSDVLFNRKLNPGFRVVIFNDVSSIAYLQ